MILKFIQDLITNPKDLEIAKTVYLFNGQIIVQDVVLQTKQKNHEYIPYVGSRSWYSTLMRKIVYNFEIFDSEEQAAQETIIKLDKQIQRDKESKKRLENLIKE